jgi:hypothetical protein
LEEFTKQLEAVQQESELAKSALPAYDAYRRLDSIEIPKLEKEIESLTSKLEIANKELEQVSLPLTGLTIAFFKSQ